MSSGTIAQPNNTLYVSNIDWSVKKPLLRRALYTLFSRHGKILEIITLRRNGLRGQAWVIFDDVQAATAALQAENGFAFFGKDLKVAYAREQSDRIAKRDGSYVPKAKRQKVKQEKEPASTTEAVTTEAAEPGAASPPAATTQPPPAAATAEQAPPSSILFAQDLPAECNSLMLEMLFRQYKGFKEVRIPRAGLAFIEFEDEPQATVALQALNGFQLTQSDKLVLNYGK